jgi:hypothetical protein
VLLSVPPTGLASSEGVVCLLPGVTECDSEGEAMSSGCAQSEGSSHTGFGRGCPGMCGVAGRPGGTAFKGGGCRGSPARGEGAFRDRSTPTRWIPADPRDSGRFGRAVNYEDYAARTGAKGHVKCVGGKRCGFDLGPLREPSPSGGRVAGIRPWQRSVSHGPDC